jgi:hypothetical protein
MTRFTSIAILFLTISLSSTVLAQGRVDTDPILYNIWLTTWKIDDDTSLKHLLQPHTNLQTKSMEIYYFKSDSLRKVLWLNKIQSGTEMTAFYFTNRKLIFISVDRNNFLLANDSTEVFKAVNSFKNEADTLFNYKLLYVKQYHSSYYFYKDKIRFAVVVTYSNKGLMKNVRHDNKNDINGGMKLFDKAKQYVLNRK